MVGRGGVIGRRAERKWGDVRLTRGEESGEVVLCGEVEERGRGERREGEGLGGVGWGVVSVEGQGEERKWGEAMLRRG